MGLEISVCRFATDPFRRRQGYITCRIGVGDRGRVILDLDRGELRCGKQATTFCVEEAGDPIVMVPVIAVCGWGEATIEFL